MALTGSFSDKYRGYTYQVAWTATQDDANNCSTITCTHRLVIASAYSLKIGARTNSCNIAGDVKSFNSPAIKKDKGSAKTITLGTTSHVVKHNSSGAGKFSIKSAFNLKATVSGVYVGSIAIDDSDTLDNISKASSFGTIEGNTIGAPITVKLIRGNSNYKHQFWYRLKGGSWVDEGTKTGSSITFTPQSSLASQLPNSSSGTLELCIQTYNGTEKVGGYVYKDITVYVGGVAPTVGTISLTPQEINNWNILVQGKNTLTIGVSGSSASTGSCIASYTFEGPDLSVTTSASSIMAGVVSTSGDLEYKVTVTDTRGFSTSSTSTITCYEYFNPYFRTFGAYRCKPSTDVSESNISSFSNISPDEKGEYVKCDFKFVYPNLSGANALKSINVYGGGGAAIFHSSSSSITQGYDGRVTVTGYAMVPNCSLEKAHNIQMIVTDSFGGKATSSIIKIYGASKIMNIKADGKAVAFGRMLEDDETNVLASQWPIKSDDSAGTMHNLTFIKSVPEDKPQFWREAGNLATMRKTTNDTTTGNGVSTESDTGYILNITDTDYLVEGKENWAQTSQLWINGYHGELAIRGSLNSGMSQWHMIPTAAGIGTYVDEYITNYIADYVVERGAISVQATTIDGVRYSAGIWDYRIWNSGFMEYYGVCTASNLEPVSSDSWGGCLYVYQKHLPVFPFEFVATPKIITSFQNINVQGITTDSVALIGGIKNSSSTLCGTIYLYRPDQQPINGQIIIHATGNKKLSTT